MEAVQLTTGTDVLELGRGVLNDPKATAAELPYTGVRLAECLRDALRVAESRGMRLPGSATEDQDHEEGEEGLG